MPRTKKRIDKNKIHLRSRRNKMICEECGSQMDFDHKTAVCPLGHKGAGTEKKSPLKKGRLIKTVWTSCVVLNEDESWCLKDILAYAVGDYGWFHFDGLFIPFHIPSGMCLGVEFSEEKDAKILCKKLFFGNRFAFVPGNRKEFLEWQVSTRNILNKMKFDSALLSVKEIPSADYSKFEDDVPF